MQNMKKNHKSRKHLAIVAASSAVMVIFAAGLFSTGCAGPAGPAGPPGPAGPAGPAGPTPSPVAVIHPETCVICHNDIGSKHRADYVSYIDKSNLELTIDSVKSNKNSDGTYTTTIKFSIKRDGLPFIDEDGLPSLEQKTVYSVTYDSATRMYDNSKSYVGSGGAGIVALGNGQYSVTANDVKYGPEQSNGQVYAYIADGPIHTEPAGHVHLYDNVASAAMAFGDVATYESPANVSGCEKCHGKPYMKHGYRNPVVEGLSDFSSCKSCHYDTRTGGHPDWQILVENPSRASELLAESEATGTSVRDLLTDAEKTRYAYKATIVNDVHMAHSMEFPYPQSMSNCATCHEGKLDMILTDANFKAETCKSCHPVSEPEEGTDPHRAPSLEAIWTEHGVGSMHNIDSTCNSCHATGASAPVFSQIHTGYNPIIYADTAGTKYSDQIDVKIDSASLSGTDLTVSLSASGNAGGLNSVDIHPDVMIALYGYDTKDFIVNGHDRYDSNNNGEISRADGDLPKGEYEVGTEHKYWTTVSQDPGKWTVTAHLSEWADMIEDGIIRRVEISVLPSLKNAEGELVALNAPSRTFDLGANAFDDDFYTDIVDVQNGCNACHDALATTFHSPIRGGNIRVCRTCHVSLAGASHLELQSRSIDSYVHAIHSFQDFDIGDIDLEDPVAAMEHEEHIAHVFPNFTIRNCEACHVPGAYDVPDQTESLPGLQSPSDVVAGRAISDVPSYVTGPASRACGGCHRAMFIKADDAVGLAAFNWHAEAGGYLIEAGEDSQSTLLEVIERIMAMFE